MKRLRNLVCLLLVISCIVSGAYAVREYYMRDNIAPVISFEEDNITVSVKNEEELFEGVTAKDNRDGDLTEAVRIASMSHFISPGKRTAEYVVFDEAGNMAMAERTITYSDYVPPRIHLTKPLRYTDREFDSVSLFANMTVEDVISGNLTNQLSMTSIDNQYAYSGMEVGTYAVSAEVSNSAGDVCRVPLEVVVTDSTNSDENSKYYPMLSEYILYTNVNQRLNLKANIIGVVQNGIEYIFSEDKGFLEFGVNDIDIRDRVDYSTPGNYNVEYTYTNSYGVTATTKVVVVVEE